MVCTRSIESSNKAAISWWRFSSYLLWNDILSIGFFALLLLAKCNANGGHHGKVDHVRGLHGCGGAARCVGA